jgi:hypothetical protein
MLMEVFGRDEIGYPKVGLPFKKPSEGKSILDGGTSLNGLPSLSVKKSTAGLKVVFPLSDIAVTI